ncbi:MAG: dynamin family protein [Gammaproteobacteria bacterium]
MQQVTTPSVVSLGFAEAREKALALLPELKSIVAGQSGMDSSAIDSLLESVKAPLFTVAVTGPSRAGKSTLINAMLRADVSPVGSLPTTGLPCLYQPGVRDRLKVILKDGQVKEEPRTIEKMREWVTQDGNPDNEKKVARVEVELGSAALDLGFALIDLPGLDDAGNDAHTLTELALEGANSVIYVMNGEDFANNRFIIVRDERLALERVAKRIEKTLFVVNKAERLSEEQRTKLLAFVEREFKRFNLPLFRTESFFFVSAESAFKARTEGAADASDETLRTFEKALWDYLIGKSEVGRSRLRASLGQANELVADQLSIASLALEKSEKVLRLKDELLKFDETETEIQLMCSQGYAGALAKVNHRIGELQPKASSKFNLYIRSIPLYQPLPTRQDVKAFLDSEVASMAGEVQRIASDSFESSGAQVSSKVQSLIQAFRSQLQGSSSSLAAVWQVGTLGPPIQGNLFPPLGGAVGLGLIGLAFGPIGGLIGAIIGFFGGLLFGESDRRAKEIADIVPKYDRAVAQAADQIAAQADRWLSASFGELQRSALTRLRAAKTALRNQLEHLGEPLTPEARASLEGGVANLRDLQPRIQAVLAALV